MTTFDQQLYKALSALAEVCDGATTQDTAGFNKFDSIFGRNLLAVPFEAWTVRQDRKSVV